MQICAPSLRKALAMTYSTRLILPWIKSTHWCRPTNCIENSGAFWGWAKSNAGSWGTSYILNWKCFLTRIPSVLTWMHTPWDLHALLQQCKCGSQNLQQWQNYCTSMVHLKQNTKTIFLLTSHTYATCQWMYTTALNCNQGHLFLLPELMVAHGNTMLGGKHWLSSTSLLDGFAHRHCHMLHHCSSFQKLTPLPSCTW